MPLKRVLPRLFLAAVSSAHRIRETVKLLCWRKPDFSLLDFFTSKKPIPLPSWLSDMDDHSGRCLSHRDPQRWWTEQRLIQIWYNLHQDIIDLAIDWQCKGLPDCVHAKGDHFKHSMWTQS